ncbi:hypothetical protein SDC9_126152 [bioreactor metagenome]|uniref:Peptidase E n=1 Tax=bioreactor metagenome TaxID=1076179 RepID=A0A645CQC4_9ZZZZ
MGRIVPSGGCNLLDEESDPILNEIFSLSKSKTPKVVYLPTASFDVEDSKDLIEERFKSFGCSEFEMLYLTDKTLTEKDIEKCILSADIIYVGGGNLKFLMDTWTETNAVKYFKIAFQQDIVLSGSSSGSLCWFQRGYDDCGENSTFMFIDCMGFMPYCNCPHYDSEWWKSFDEAVKKQDLSGVAIDNDTALSYCDGKYRVIKAYDEKSAYFFDANKNYEMCDITEILVDGKFD